MFLPEQPSQVHQQPVMRGLRQIGDAQRGRIAASARAAGGDDRNVLARPSAMSNAFISRASIASSTAS